MNWESLDPRRFERGVQALLKILHPGLRSFDGAGGDGGKDAQLWITADGSTVFEIKSFGRLTGSRRKQTEKSLRAALTSTPSIRRWILVIPMNMTPRRPTTRSSEEVWFYDRLAGIAGDVELDWWGQDWLDAQIAERMDLQRYMEGIDGQLLQRASELNQEAAALATGDDYRARLRNLVQRGDEISMFWRMVPTMHEGRLTTMLEPKVPDAHIIDPISITPTFSFPDDAAAEALRQQFEQTVAFGGRVDLPPGFITDLRIDASDEARALLGSPPEAAETGLTLMSHRTPLDRHARCSYQVLDDNQHVIAEFPVFLRERTGGTTGVNLYGSDAAGIASFKVSVPLPSELNPTGETPVTGAALQLDMPTSLAGYDIDSLLPVTRTLAIAASGTYLRFTMPGFGFVGGPALEESAFPTTPAIHQVVEDLHRIAQRNGSVLRFPANVTNAQVEDLRRVVRQMDGETVDHNGGLVLNFRPTGIAPLLEAMERTDTDADGNGFSILTDDRELTVGDLTLWCGPSAFRAPRPRLLNREELEDIVANGSDQDEIAVRIEPTDTPFHWTSQAQAAEYVAAAQANES